MIELYQYDGEWFPDYLKRGNAMRFILPIAEQFCMGHGLDVGCGKWPFPGAIGVDLENGGSAMDLPQGQFDYVFSSHCLEHLSDPIAAIEHWRSRLKPFAGTLFLHLPHPSMRYWRPQHCRKHRHIWWPSDIVDILVDLGFERVIHSERDLAWSFSVVAFNG